MDSGLVSGLLSAEGGECNNLSPSLTYTEQFYKSFPYYLAIGMTYEEYWESDPALVKYYREADAIRNDKKNQELWLQGLYIYEALCDVAPIFRSFSKKDVKAESYPDRPYPLTRKQRRLEMENKERELFEKGHRFMRAFMKSTNAHFDNQG